MTLTIGGREYLLSPRRAVDVLELAAATQKQETPDTTLTALTMVQVVSDSLKSTYKALGRIRGHRYRQFIGPRGTKALLEALSVQELANAVEKIGELEGVKKKDLTAAANLSGDS